MNGAGMRWNENGGSRYVLNKKESEVMNAVFLACETDGLCLISPNELMTLLPPRRKYTEESLDKILHELALDDYFQLLSTQKKGEKTYVISLHASGLAFRRNSSQQRRAMLSKFAWAVASAVIAFVVGLLLKRIF